MMYRVAFLTLLGLCLAQKGSDSPCGDKKICKKKQELLDLVKEVAEDIKELLPDDKLKDNLNDVEKKFEEKICNTTFDKEAIKAVKGKIERFHNGVKNGKVTLENITNFLNGDAMNQASQFTGSFFKKETEGNQENNQKKD
ncbi:hypothetical protein GDO86_013517 [Hymenochirus boettgeri]|uniref:Uncharacterized protein n=1 Tax=Hymenochirus boettgeri TaxID=247094 RepID=A0A8T2IV58_9PIPI|nr:hypothetical protein GDO86_013517 [Hymenochirus boettgeri]